jgi:hypothetical protein
MKKQLIVGLSAALLAAGCASTDKEKQDIAGVPNWVTSPSYKDGIAATECVPKSANFSLDRKEAVANARQALAQQIDLKVKAMDKTYQRRTRGEEKTATGSTFESVSRQVTETNLNGSRVVKTGYVDLGGQKNMCVMVAFGDSEMQKIFDDLVEASGKELNAQDEDVLYQEFKAHKAQQALDKELAN